MRFWMYTLLGVILFIGLGFGCLAQAYDDDDDETFSDSVLLTKEMSGGFILHSMGWGLEFRKGRNINANKLWLMEIDFSEMKSPKEIRVINPYFSNAKSYIYGKLNNVYLIRAGYGRHRLLNSKPYWGGVALRYFFSGGASFGLAKPVYLNIINLVSISPQYFEYELTTEKYNPEKHFRDNIYGRAAFVKGFNQMSFYPGIYGKFGFTFDFGPHDASIKTLEVGATLDLFPIPIPMMAYNDPEYYFLTIYLSVNFGKRFNR